MPEDLQQGGHHKFPKWAWIALGVVVVIGVIMFVRNSTSPAATKTAPGISPTNTDTTAIAAALAADEKKLADYEAATQAQLTTIGGAGAQNTADLQTISGSIAQAEKDILAMQANAANGSTSQNQLAWIAQDMIRIEPYDIADKLYKDFTGAGITGLTEPNKPK